MGRQMLEHMGVKEKVIQAMGRIGRNNIQQTYTVRFRDDSQIAKLFTSETEKPEVRNMNILFNSTKVRYENGQYIEMPDENEELINHDNGDEFEPYEEDEDYEENDEVELEDDEA